jgi:signal transduction histidine kinase
VRARTEDLAVLARRIERVHEDERRRLAHELHDELGQSLTALRLELAALDDRALGEDAREALDARLDELLESVHWTVSSLRPKPLEEHGLGEGCRWLVDRFRVKSRIEVSLTLELGSEPPPDVALTLFRVLQESLTNVAKHAEARAVHITLRGDRERLVLEVRDDGVGFDPGATSSGHGLSGMRERALAVGGALALRPSKSGTEVVLTVPHQHRGALP